MRVDAAGAPADRAEWPGYRRLLAAEAARRGETRITEKEVRAALDARAAPAALRRAAAAGAAGEGEVVTLNTMRRRTGERLAENWRTIPHVFQAIEVDFTALDRARQRRKDAFQAEHGFSLTYLPFIARATCLAIEAFPLINARFADKRAGQVARHPSRRRRRSLPQRPRRSRRARRRRSHAGRPRQGDEPADRKGARGQADAPTTSQAAPIRSATTAPSARPSPTPIINAPQVAILSADAIRLKPAVVSTPEGDFVAPRLIGMVGQSFDHRAFDGAYSAAFLSRLKQILEGAQLERRTRLSARSRDPFELREDR